MKKPVLLKLLVLFLTILTLSGCLGIASFAVGGKMACNIYVEPQASLFTSGKYDAYMIDFCSPQDPYCTYWALANWSMDTTASRLIYRGINGGGCYAGLQSTGPTSKTAIMAFWLYNYQGSNRLDASRVYPGGNESGFGGEGEGVNWITPHAWQANKWYRMLLKCWTDSETGTTFVGEWFLDVESGKWTLISVFDTKLKDSFFKGNMSQFMENFTESTSDAVRECRYKNYYFLDHTDNLWKSVNQAKISTDYTAQNKSGTYSFGATDEYFWGITDGTAVDKVEYAKTSQKTTFYTIKQPEQPTLMPSSVASVTGKEVNGKQVISWKFSDASAPQQGYKLEIYDEDGTIIKTFEQNRPDVTRMILDDLGENYSVKLYITDVFGGTCEASGTSVALQNAEDEEAIQAGLSELSSKVPEKEFEATVSETLSSISEAVADGYKSMTRSRALDLIAELNSTVTFVDAAAVESNKQELSDFVSDMDGKIATGEWKEKVATTVSDIKTFLEGSYSAGKAEELTAAKNDILTNATLIDVAVIWLIAGGVVAVAAVVVVLVVVTKRKKKATV